MVLNMSSIPLFSYVLFFLLLCCLEGMVLWEVFPLSSDSRTSHTFWSWSSSRRLVTLCLSPLLLRFSWTILSSSLEVYFFCLIISSSVFFFSSTR